MRHPAAAETNPIPDCPRRILIVDDERDNRELLEVVLVWEGFDVVTAASGATGLAIVAEQSVDLVLLDIMMPDMNGYEVVAKLKGDLATKDTPVMLVSALTDRNARTLGLSAGADDFLGKPVDRHELLFRVNNLLRAKA